MRARPETGPRTGSGTGHEASGAIEVDFAGLSRLVGTARRLADQLTGNGDLCGHVNDPDLADAFHRLNRDWHKQRVTLQTFLDTTADSVAASLVVYRQLETDLAHAPRG